MKILSLIFLAALLFAALFAPSGVPVQSQSSTGTSAGPRSSEKVLPDESGGDYFSIRFLSSDLRNSDVVAHVNISKLRYLDRSDPGTDCEKNTRGGYCAYELTGEVKEVFKGDKTAKTIAFVVTPEATYPRERLLGERVVFLVRSHEAKKPSLETIENSTRPIEHDVLGKMRKLIDPQASINEEDENEPYSRVSIRNDFNDAAAVVYVDIREFRPLEEDAMSFQFTFKATVKESFKGAFRSGQEIVFTESFLYRRPGREDLGPRVIYLEKADRLENGVYSTVPNSRSEIRHGILEKLREISRQP